MSCSNNLKQLGIALHSYHDARGTLPPGCASDTSPYGTGGGWGSSWKVFILPYIEQDNIFRQWRFIGNSGYVDTNNQGLINRVTIKTYRCPASPLPDFSPYQNVSGDSNMFSSYTGVAGSAADATATAASECCSGSGINSQGGVLFIYSTVKLTDITDGTSNTIMVGEQSDHLRSTSGAPYLGGYGAITSQGPHGWAMGTGSSAANNRCFNCTTVRWSINQRGLDAAPNANGTNDNTGMNIPFSSNHSGGANMLFGDGSVKYLSDSTAVQTLQWLATRTGGEVLPNF